MKRQAKRVIAQIFDWLLMPFVYVSARLLKYVRARGVQRLPRCKATLLQVGVFPIRNHYYEPQFDLSAAKRPFSEPRNLTGIDWNTTGQLELLAQFTFADELKDTSRNKSNDLEFYLDNGNFESGDAEYWYQFIRLKKPRRIFEIGSGHSTLMAIQAVRRNQADDRTYTCQHVCIEPFEMPWLEQLGISVVRKKVEDVGIALFQELEEGDVLFIDSSHVVRPVGDVVFEYLELLPTLRRGVVVHVHDIFSPRNYPHSWLVDEIRLWTEQYILEAFLTHNDSWRVIGSLNYLKHDHFQRLRAVCPFLTPDREPGSIYLQKIG